MLFVVYTFSLLHTAMYMNAVEKNVIAFQKKAFLYTKGDPSTCSEANVRLHIYENSHTYI